jgi:hypothetical protein
VTYAQLTRADATVEQKRLAQQELQRVRVEEVEAEQAAVRARLQKHVGLVKECGHSPQQHNKDRTLDLDPIGRQQAIVEDLRKNLLVEEGVLKVHPKTFVIQHVGADGTPVVVLGMTVCNPEGFWDSVGLRVVQHVERFDREVGRRQALTRVLRSLIERHPGNQKDAGLATRRAVWEAYFRGTKSNREQKWFEAAFDQPNVVVYQDINDAPPADPATDGEF